MNANDYSFFEENPDFSFEGCECFIIPSSYSFSDIKDLDKSFLDEPRNAPLIQNSFLRHVEERSKYNVIRNAVTGECIFPMTPVRGNRAYAYRKHKKLQPVIDSFENCEFSKPFKGGRKSEVRLIHAVMITLSYTRSYGSSEKTSLGYPVKHWSCWDAWQSLKGSNSLINQFKVEFSRAVGSNYASCTVKEGCKDMYPAPHMIMILDKPLVAHRWGKKWLIGNKMDRGIVDKIQSSWERIAGSHCKIVPIMDAKGFTYAFKYIQKSIDTKVEDVSEMTDAQLVCCNTHLNHALHDLNDIVPKSFLEKLNCVKEQNLLDITRSKLKQKNNELLCKIQVIEGLGGFNRLVYPAYRDLFEEYYSLLSEIDRLKAEIHEMKMEISPWFFVRGGFCSIESATAYSESE
ncbi:MAG: hypothetical protein KA502_00005 [Candidatus Methanomethylophilaceae archaeon]|nr:hypothetical protein [Candidatus Methanomethylophilaceae archaeon]